jgi:hypothetical protein
VGYKHLSYHNPLISRGVSQNEQERFGCLSAIPVISARLRGHLYRALEKKPQTISNRFSLLLKSLQDPMSKFCLYYTGKTSFSKSFHNIALF